MPYLIEDLQGAGPVDAGSAPVRPRATLRTGTELRVTKPKLRRPSKTIEIFWSEIQACAQLYRVPRRALESALAA